MTHHPVMGRDVADVVILESVRNELVGRELISFDGTTFSPGPIIAKVEIVRRTDEDGTPRDAVLLSLLAPARLTLTIEDPHHSGLIWTREV